MPCRFEFTIANLQVTFGTGTMANDLHMSLRPAKLLQGGAILVFVYTTIACIRYVPTDQEPEITKTR